LGFARRPAEGVYSGRGRDEEGNGREVERRGGRKGGRRKGGPMKSVKPRGRI